MLKYRFLVLRELLWEIMLPCKHLNFRSWQLLSMAPGATYQIVFCYCVLLSIFGLPQSIPCRSPPSSRRGQGTVLFPLSPTSFCHFFLLYQTVQSARFYYLLVKFSEMPEKNKDSLKIIVWTYPRVCCALTEYPHGPFCQNFLPCW